MKAKAIPPAESDSSEFEISDPETSEPEIIEHPGIVEFTDSSGTRTPPISSSEDNTSKHVYKTTDLDDLLIRIKQNYMNIERPSKVRDAAEKLHNTIKAAKLVISGSPTDNSYIEFQKNCDDAINEARPILETIPFWKQVLATLGNIILAITLIVPLTIFCQTGRYPFTLFNPKSAWTPHLDDLKTTVDHEAYP